MRYTGKMMNAARRFALLLSFSTAVLAGCAINSASPDEKGEVTAGNEKVVVVVQDDTDKAYTNDVGDVSALYRDLANEVATFLTGSGVPASTFDAPHAIPLTIHLTRISAAVNDDQTVRLKCEYTADLGDWHQSYSPDNTFPRPFSGTTSPSDFRQMIIRLIAGQLTADESLMAAAKK